MNTGTKHKELVVPCLGQAILLCFLSAVLTLAVAAGYGPWPPCGKGAS